MERHFLRALSPQQHATRPALRRGHPDVRAFLFMRHDTIATNTRPRVEAICPHLGRLRHERAPEPHATRWRALHGDRYACADEGGCNFALCEACYNHPGPGTSDAAVMAGRVVCLAAEGAKKKFALAGLCADTRVVARVAVWIGAKRPQNSIWRYVQPQVSMVSCFMSFCLAICQLMLPTQKVRAVLRTRPFSHEVDDAH